MQSIPVAVFPKSAAKGARRADSANHAQTRVVRVETLPKTNPDPRLACHASGLQRLKPTRQTRVFTRLQSIAVADRI
jgi:hypothetical protein